MIESACHAVAADHVFDGTVVHESAAVAMDNTRVVQAVPRVDVPRTITVRLLPKAAWLAPGFIDLQVNGGGDVLFNDQPPREGIYTTEAPHRKFAKTGPFPTLF